MDVSKTFFIDRSKWRCGGYTGLHIHGGGPTQLLNAAGYMCCLGQVSLQLGCKRAQIKNAQTPCGVSVFVHELHGVLLTDSGWATSLTVSAMDINDDSKLDDATRESKLAALFAKHGYTLTFTGEYANSGS